MRVEMAAFLSLLLLASIIGDAHPAGLVGRYDANQIEVAAGLELSADGRFRYGLSYGALDEQATGTWHAAAGRVILDSDPVKAPRFTLLGQSRGEEGFLHVDLQVPEGMDAQYFRAVIQLTDGRQLGGQLSADGLSLPLEVGQRPARIRIVLPVIELVGDPVEIDAAKGLRFRFGFEPNDLGRVEFKGTALTMDKGQLILLRHGVELHFRPRGADGP
jgi:hypothetical protein